MATAETAGELTLTLPWETDTRCGTCGEFLKIKQSPKYPHTVNVMCGSSCTRVLQVGLEWAVSEFCAPYGQLAYTTHFANVVRPLYEEK